MNRFFLFEYHRGHYFAPACCYRSQCIGSCDFLVKHSKSSCEVKEFLAKKGETGSAIHEPLVCFNFVHGLFDGLGSIVGLTDSSSSKVNDYDYDASGIMLNQVEGVSNPFKFVGGYLDASDYYQFGERYYDPSLGRWTQQDPVGGSLGGSQLSESVHLCRE